MGDEPKGLGQSLDDLIRENQQKRERRAIAPKPQGGVNKARSNTAPKDVRCFINDEGSVVMQYKNTALITIRSNGDMILSAGGFYGSATLGAMNMGLNALNMRITAPTASVSSGEWSVSDGRSLQRFREDMVLPAKTPPQRGRGMELFKAMNESGSGQGEGFHDIPMHAEVPGRFDQAPVAYFREQQQYQQPQAFGDPGNVFARLGHASDEQRRLARQGRFVA
ncbi:hypothetical protein H632_c73p1 [Helicosporidium sp. ATCC 50920]|nr:hypothetical protein H632_c73p1 [Helicosporidium sp. ATCC 50920]|eukprot:KDD76896.1 hypothetical protein H632_c73p1 [Helicosporidium sp. ATCC 50920]